MAAILEMRDLSRKIFSTSPECLERVYAMRVPLSSNTWAVAWSRGRGLHVVSQDVKLLCLKAYQAVPEALPFHGDWLVCEEQFLRGEEG